jgi:FemAB-related protein (PEP-CTERM system-associated)
VTSAGLQIRELDEPRRRDWDQFVIDCGKATFFHRAGWKSVIEHGFHHDTHYLYAERAGAIEGILPLVHIKSRLFGASLSSLPFLPYAGPVASSEVALAALDSAARTLAEELDVSYLEYRHIVPGSYTDAIDKADLYVTFQRPIYPDLEKNMLAIPRKQRAMVRKAKKLGLRSEIDSDCERLYRVYSESARNLGTPVFSRRYFDELKREFGDACEVLVIMHRDQPVSGVMSFYFRDEVLPYYGGGTKQARALAANDLMYWEVMRHAWQRGCRSFDFGRSKRGTGAFDFKKNWGFPAQSLHYQYIMRRGSRPPDINPLNPKFRVFIRMWKQLPLPVANVLGPCIVRHLG